MSSYETNSVNVLETDDIGVEEVKKLNLEINKFLCPLGFEVMPFLVGWYNNAVADSFKLPYDPFTLAFVIISTPAMFEKAFIPYVLNHTHPEIPLLRDPIDQCMIFNISKVKQQFPTFGVDTFHDFEITPSRRPRVLVQTCGHVSGAVRYYQKSDLAEGVSPWPTEAKIYGVCLHPEYGGWFALRAATIFTKVRCLCLQINEPPHILKTDIEIIELLRRFNESWEDWSFRDMIEPKQRYSLLQQQYFSTKPAERGLLTEQLKVSLANLKSNA